MAALVVEPLPGTNSRPSLPERTVQPNQDQARPKDQPSSPLTKLEEDLAVLADLTADQPPGGPPVPQAELSVGAAVGTTPEGQDVAMGDGATASTVAPATDPQQQESKRAKVRP